MTLNNTDQFDTAAPAAPTRPIGGIATWYDSLDFPVQSALRAIGELLTGMTTRDAGESADQFTARCLEVDSVTRLLNEERELSNVSLVTTAVALAELIATHRRECEIGPGDFRNPPQWTQTTIGSDTYRHPLCLRAFFPAGTVLDEASCVIHIEARESYMSSADVSAFVTPNNQDGARTVLDHLAARASALNPYRGRAVRATYRQGLSFAMIPLPETATRDTVVVSESVWTEIDLGISAVRDHHKMLNDHGLGSRRGVLLCGPPGTGKSAVCTVAANEVLGSFTVIYVEAEAGAKLLTAVVEEAQRIGGPVLLVLEDVDLWCSDRKAGGPGGLSELLQAMDIKSDSQILTLASTNDSTTLDKAAMRTGRFDSVVEIGYPTRLNAGRILTALMNGLPGSDHINIETVTAALPAQTSGSDLREIVRRAALSTGGNVDTESLVAEVGSGRYRATVPEGMYL